MTNEEALRSLVNLLTAFKIIEFWSISIDDDSVWLSAISIRGKIYGDVDQHAYEYIMKNKK